MNTQIQPLYAILFFLLWIWTLFWKGLALWKSAQYKQRNWFIVLFLLILVNTAGLIDIIYLFRFAKTRLTLKDLSFLKFWKKKS